MSASNRWSGRPMAWLAAGLLTAALLAPGIAAAAQQEERWRGLMDLTALGAGEMEFFVDFAIGADGGVSARISIPAQGARGLPLTDVVHSDTELAFTLATQPAAVYRAARDGDGASGTLRQGPAAIPIRMERLVGDAATVDDRPQTPRPPFPYETREAAYTNPVDDTRLAGTLSVPEGNGPHPAAILITGSGAQDRDETIFDHKPFLVVADHLTRQGVAVLRVDDRGVGGSSGSIATSTSQDFAGDVLAGVAWLQEQPEIDPARIGLIGHSEGGIVAPIAAARSNEIAFIVLLAGPGLPGIDIMPEQLRLTQEAIGRPPENVARQVQAQVQLHDRLVAGAPQQEIAAAARALIEVQLDNAPAAQRPDAATLEQLVQATVAQVSTPWYRAFLVNDPREYLARASCPILALNGSLDLQVPASENLRAIREAALAAGNDDVTVHELEGLNHLFQNATTGSVVEYAQLTETFSPDALELMSSWIRARVGLE